MAPFPVGGGVWEERKGHVFGHGVRCALHGLAEELSCCYTKGKVKPVLILPSRLGYGETLQVQLEQRDGEFSSVCCLPST